MSDNTNKKIFISHASADALIGEKLLDALVELGVDKSTVFYSSLYHTGIKLGDDFHQKVKTALNDVEIVLFLLTRSFYKSEYCLNEMGAVWCNNKRFIPILLDGLSYADMKGFIDGHYIAFQPDISKSYKLSEELRPYIDPSRASSAKATESIFKDFIDSANTMAAESAKNIPAVVETISQTERMLLEHRFTDGEVLLMKFFAETQTNLLNDVVEYDPSSHRSEDSKALKAIKAYAEKYTFDYVKAKHMLEQSSLLKNEYEYYGNEEYAGCTLSIDAFRDFISFSEAGRAYVQEVLNRNFTAVARIVSTNTEQKVKGSNTTELEAIITSKKFKELEALLLCYMLNTSSNSLGDRWMADVTTGKIRMWESMNNLNNKLSSGYSDALNMLKFRNLVDVASTTSYGNPREYKLKDEYMSQMADLPPAAEKVLEDVKNKNAIVIPDEELPF